MKKIKTATLLFVLMLALTACKAKEGDNTIAGFEAIEASDFATAISCFQAGIVSGENLELCYRGLGIAYLESASYEEALAAFEKALDNGGLFAGELERDINFYMATIYYKLGQEDDALELLDAILASDKKNSDAHFLKGMMLIDSDYETAIENLEASIDYADNTIEKTVAVYEVLEGAGYSAIGQTYLTSLLEDTRNLTEYYAGMIYYYLGDYENARNYLETARLSDKNNKRKIVLILGMTYEQLGDSAYASTLYNSYLSDADGDAEIYNRLGLCKLEAGDYTTAIQAFEAGLAMADGTMYQTLLFNEIVAYEKKGDFAMAKSLMSQYIAKYPSDETAQREYEFLSTR